MAGGIDWFRWHHGSVTDPKFQLVARKAGASLPDVLAVWAYVLEQASASEQRGSIGEIDAEALDCLFGFPSTETRTANILKAFSERGLIEYGTVTAWEKRQPKRERDTDSSAERTRAYRERQKAPDKTTETHVTPCDASDDQKNARGEERREEGIQEPTVLVGSPPAGVESAPPDRVVKLVDRRIPCPADALLEAFHAECPTLPRVIKLNDKRRDHLRNRWREIDADSKFTSPEDGIEVFRGVFRKVNASDFLTGRAKSNGRRWSASFDWLFESSTNFLKVCEGQYDNESSRRQADQFAGAI